MGKEGKMMRKTMEKRKDFDIKQWKKMGKQWKRWKEQGENNGKKMRKERKMMRKTMEKRRDFDIKQWKKWESNGNGGKNRERVK